MVMTLNSWKLNENLPKVSSSLNFLGLFHHPYGYAILENVKLENETC